MTFMRGVFCKFACKKWLLCKNYHFKSYCWILKYDIIIDLGHQLNLFSLSQTFLKVKYVFKGKKMWQMPGFFFFFAKWKILQKLLRFPHKFCCFLFSSGVNIYLVNYCKLQVPCIQVISSYEILYGEFSVNVLSFKHLWL